MENFVLYEELDKGVHHKTYKGRRKDTINFLTIHRVHKCKRPEITNMVRLMHEIKHKNIVKFYEWYETTNNLWLILELCTGGTLSKLIAEDDHLPETSIRKFGSDLVSGLHHVHSIGIVFSDINPNKIVFNGPGDLKFSDFGLSRVEGENLEQLLESYMEAGEGFGSVDPESLHTEKSDVPKQLRTRGTPNYMSPEVLNGEDPSMASDFWSLGCVLHEMFTGHPPFLAEDFQQLRKKILSKDFAPPKVKGSRVNSGKPSAEFQSLLDGLLDKDPKKRIAWPQLVVHPFWQGELSHLTMDDMTTQSVVRQSFRQSVANFPLQMSTAAGDDVSKTNIGQPVGHERTTDETDAGQHDSETSTTLQLPRPDLADREPQVLFTISARPGTAGLEDEMVVDEHLTSASPQKKSPGGAMSCMRKTNADNFDDRNDISSLVFHSTDFQVVPIIDVAKQSQKLSFKYDPKALSVPPFTAEKLVSLSSQDQGKHFGSIIESLSVTEKGPPSQKQIHLFNYIAMICSNSLIANALVRQGVLTLLSRQIKDTQQMELKSRLGLIIGTIANNVTELDQSTNIAEVMTTLTEVARDGFRVTKVKIAVLPALGELLYLVATQEELKRCSLENWSIPSLTYHLVIRCLNETEEAVTHQLAVKIIENIATKTGQHSLKFAVNEVALLLWHVFTHATGDMLRITSLSALSRLSRFSPVIVQNVIEKVGLQKLLSALSIPVTRIQQAVVTMLAALITSDSTKQTRIIQDKELMTQTMRLLESPSVVVRAKAFLVILSIITGNNDSLLTACQNRLVMYVERDRRKQAVGKIDSSEQTEYLSRCLDLLMLEMLDAVPQVSKELLTALDSACGRKHPSSVQVKQLRSSLPLLALLQHLVASSAFRSKIISESFMKNLASFLGHVLGIESGTTQIQSATGPLGTEEFIHTVFAIVENVVQHSSNVTDYAIVVVDRLLPSLAALISSCTGETRTSSLRLFSEIVTVFVNQESPDAAQIQLQTKKLHHLVTESLLPQYEQLLLDQDPLPLHGLKLLMALVEQYPAFIRDIEQFNLVPVFFQVLVDHQSNPVSSTMQQVAGLLNSLVTRKETNMKSLYDHGFVEHFSYLFQEVSSVSLGTEENSGNIKAVTTMLLLLLETLHGILKYVSEVVRRALETKKGGGDNVTVEAEQAEALLLVNKPFTEFVSPLTQLLVHEDSDVADTSLKCLALLLQFFGGDHANSMSVRNMECYSEALKKADLKKQKIILRLIKRLIATDAHHLEMMKLQGSKLAEMIKTIERTASANAEIALSSVATEILKAAGYKN